MVLRRTPHHTSVMDGIGDDHSPPSDGIVRSHSNSTSTTINNNTSDDSNNNAASSTAAGTFSTSSLPLQPPSPVPQEVLHRHLTLLDLIAIGIGGTIGSGLFVLAGLVAHQYAGPATVVSWLLAGAAAGMSGCCYAELGVEITCVKRSDHPDRKQCLRHHIHCDYPPRERGGLTKRLGIGTLG